MGTGFPGRRDNVCKDTELSDSRKHQEIPSDYHAPEQHGGLGEEESFFPKSGLSGSKCQVVQCKKSR